jgi:hypothetical protein
MDDALMRVMRDECIDASALVSSHMHFYGECEPDHYRMVIVYIV